MSRQLFILPLICLCTPFAIAQLPSPISSTPVGVASTVRLEPHDGKTQFFLGDQIQLDLVFQSHGAIPITLNTTLYGDIADKVDITPANGWFQWRGQSGHDYSVATPLTSTEIRVPLALNQGFVFREPGHYDITVTTRRLHTPVTTNTIGIDLAPMPAGDEQALVRTLVSEISSSTPDHCHCRDHMHDTQRKQAIRRLADLQGDDALQAKVNLILQQDEDMRTEAHEALASTRNLTLELKLLEAGWADPDHPPVYDLPYELQEVRAFLRGETQQGWSMLMMPPKPTPAAIAIARDHTADMDILIHSLAARKGQDRADAAYQLLEDRTLTPEQLSAVRPIAIQEFPYMQEIEQSMLLDTAWKNFSDPALAPLIRSQLDKDPYNRYAIKRLIELDPSSAKPYVIRAICDPSNVMPLDNVGDLPETTLPEIDTCLGDLLKTAPKRDGDYHWTARATLAARFASPAIIPAVREGWFSTAQDGPVVALLLRYSPAEAIARIEANPDRFTFFFTINKVFESRHASFPPELLTLFRHDLKDGPDDKAITAAYELSKAGEPQDRLLLEKRLARLRASEALALTEKPNRLESELISGLRNANAWKLTDAELAELGRGCISDSCRNATKPSQH